ncbi:MAG: InlB B-repeat-containing protein [Clostridiales bacterium]|nr:InlB B-repeat-containing protein [Clostridiales bacterium]
MKRKILSLLLSLSLLMSVIIPASLAFAETGETAKITVNYVYESNKAMVAQPYQAQIAEGSDFQKTLEIPKLFNYSIPTNKAEGLSENITLNMDESTKEYTLSFNLTNVTEDVTVTLYYVAGTAKYKVYHYYQNLENDDYTDAPPKVFELEGDIDAYTEAVAENQPGYHCNGVPQTTIAADGTTEVEIYYDRDYYTVVFDVNGGVNGPEPIYAKYGTTFEAKTIKEPSRKGYTFLGWQPILADTVTIDGNVTYVAQWQPEKGQADYTIVIWGQNANDDEYSYLSSHEAWGQVGNSVTWTPEMLICQGAHVHNENCYAFICEKEEHSHSKDCYANVGSESSAGIDAPNNPANGTIARKAWTRNEKVIYIDGKWYDYNGNASIGSTATSTCGKTEHKHTDYTGSCYELICTLEGHTHTDDCYMGSLHPGEALWTIDHSDTVTVDANGSTVLNVYFKRTEFTLTFRYGRNNNTTQTIQARWGKNIASEYNAIVKEAGSSFWSRNRDASGPYTNYIGVMPAENRTYYNKTESGKSNTMYYYAENLNGEYEEIFRISFGGTYYVTDEDRYEFEGFTYDHGTNIGENCNGAEFYYKRNSYNLDFYSASNNTTDQSKAVQYQMPLGEYDYVPTAKPDSVEDDAVFVGWYLNPECTGEQYDLSAHTMPSNNIALYAKWVNGLYTVTTYTDDTMQSFYTYEGYDGKQENIEKYTLAVEPTPPTKDGYVFIGWFYKDGETEKPFSFTMPITKDYDLYPKFSEPQAVTYTVHYYKAGTTEQVADDRTNSVMIGTTVTEKAKMGTELNRLPADKQNKYYPTNTSTSVIINQLDQEIIFYYKEASSVSYTVYYQDTNGNDLIDPVTKTTEYSTVTESYVPIDNYAPRQYQIMKDLSVDETQNKIIFIYDPTLTTLTITKSGADVSKDPNQSFIFYVKGADENTKDIDITVVINGNGSKTIQSLPVGTYTVTEDTQWSWRYRAQSSNPATIEAKGGDVKNEIIFTNDRTADKWLDGNAYCRNLFK